MFQGKQRWYPHESDGGNKERPPSSGISAVRHPGHSQVNILRIEKPSATAERTGPADALRSRGAIVGICALTGPVSPSASRLKAESRLPVAGSAAS